MTTDEPELIDVEDRPDLAALLDRVAEGDEISIRRGGHPIATLTAVASTADRRPGALRGRLWWAPGSDTSDLEPDMADLMEHGPVDPPAGAETDQAEPPPSPGSAVLDADDPGAAR